MLIRLLSLVLSSGLAVAAFALSAPALIYSTYLRDGFTPNAIATDASGNIYLAGNILIDPAGNQTTVLVVKLNAQGTQYLYSRYLGGSVNDMVNAIAVDSGGNAYIAGQTASPDFPVTRGGNLGTPSTGLGDYRSFVTKLDPTGNVLFSDLLGGPTASAAQAVAITTAGNVIVSGVVQKSSPTSVFPTTPGAYSIPDTNLHPYLLELDTTGTKTIFSATGIGGSALALDSGGNIFVAGSTSQLDYPTTPGAYQTTFPSFFSCLFPCQIASQGANQYVTKVDPTGSKLIYSTSISGNGNTINAGLAVDNAGNAYVTGFAGAGYPYTDTPPAIPALPGESVNLAVLPYLTKLDPAGHSLLFSVPVGGAGVQVDSGGLVYVGGRIGYSPGSEASLAVTANLPALASVPQQCLPNALVIRNSAYVSQADAVSGNVLGTQFIGGSNLSPSAVVLSGPTLWIAGATGGPDVPFTPNALATDFGGPYYGSNLGAGAFLGAVDFSQPQPAAGTPQPGCLLDAADFSPVGTVSRYQVLSLFGTGLGPTVGMNAPDNATTNLGGVSITFDGTPAILLYVSSTQINFAVPLTRYNQYSAVMQVTVNGLTAKPRQLPFDYGNPHLFINTVATYLDSTNLNQYFIPLGFNGDGSVNASSNPASRGSTVSVFVNGIAPDPDVTNAPLQLYATGGWTVSEVALINPFIFRVDLQVPSVFCGVGPPNLASPPPCAVSLALLTAAGLRVNPNSDVVLYVSQ